MSLYRKPINKPRPRLGGMSSDLPPDVEQRAQTIVQQSALPAAAPVDPVPAAAPARAAAARTMPTAPVLQSDSRETSRSVPLQVIVPEYVDTALRQHLSRGVTMRRLVLDALSKQYGIEIAPEDLEDGRRNRGRNAR